MKNKISFCDLKMLHENARIAKAGSKDWIEFATTMLDKFPAIYEKAKSMDANFHRLRNQVATGKEIIQAGIEIMEHEQVGKWAGVRTFLEQEACDYSETPNVKLRGAL